MSGIELPWTITLQTYADLLRLEDAIRAALQCEGTGCAALQSSEYARLKIELRHMLIMMSRWWQYKPQPLPLLSEALRSARPLYVLDHAIALYVSSSFNPGSGGGGDQQLRISLTLNVRELALELDPSLLSSSSSTHSDDDYDDDGKVVEASHRSKKPREGGGLVGQPSLSRRFHGLQSFEAQLLLSKRRRPPPTPHHHHQGGSGVTPRGKARAPKSAHMMHSSTSLST
jgi:hypothetical protein